MAIKKSFNHSMGFSYDYHKPSGYFCADFSASFLRYEIESYKSQTQRNSAAKTIEKQTKTITDVDFTLLPENASVHDFFTALAYADMKKMEKFSGYENDLDNGAVPLLSIDPDHPDYIEEEGQQQEE